MPDDRLRELFQLRKTFMNALIKSHDCKDEVENLDIGSREVQLRIRDLALKGVEEVFEVMNELKNRKTHRKTEIKGVNREKLLEEWVDAFNFFFSAIILAGFDDDDFFEAYLKKDKIIHQRIRDDY